MKNLKQSEIRDSAARLLNSAAELGEAGIRKAKDQITLKSSEIRRRGQPLDESNWYGRAAQACEDVSDSILREKPGTSERIVTVTAGKLGAIGLPSAIFSTAALLGTAATGTAIGSLSGAAFTSAALSWLAGSVAVGSIVIGFAGIAGGLGAALGAGWIAKKFMTGKKSESTPLDEKEQKIIDASLALALAFKNQEKAGAKVDPMAAKALYDDALKPLCDELLEHKHAAQNWPYIARKRFERAFQELVTVTSSLHHWSAQHPHIATGIVSAVITQLLADEIPAFDANEQIVLDALRRSKNSLHDASDEELAAYVQELSPEQLHGLGSNLLGISHELRFFVEENGDGDEYFVELFEQTNHPGSDVKIINSLTGEIKEFQLKATNYRSYIEEHNERYGDIPVLATEEIALDDDTIGSTGIYHAELKEDVSSVLSGLDDFDDPGVLSSMSVAAMITLARNVKVLLKGKRISADEKRRLIKDGARSAIVSGLVHTVIG